MEAMTDLSTMLRRSVRVPLVALDAFLGVTAVLGGLGLLLRWYPPPPTALLTGSPFGSDTIPALLLTLVVGGSGLIATVAVLVRHALAAAASAVAGLIIIGFEAVQMAVIGFAWLQVVYIVNGLLILALAAPLWASGRTVPAAQAGPATGRLAA
jgi:hypothetical protein